MGQHEAHHTVVARALLLLVQSRHAGSDALHEGGQLHAEQVFVEHVALLRELDLERLQRALAARFLDELGHAHKRVVVDLIRVRRVGHELRLCSKAGRVRIVPRRLLDRVSRSGSGRITRRVSEDQRARARCSGESVLDAQIAECRAQSGHRHALPARGLLRVVGVGVVDGQGGVLLLLLLRTRIVVVQVGLLLLLFQVEVIGGLRIRVADQAHAVHLLWFRHLQLGYQRAFEHIAGVARVLWLRRGCIGLAIIGGRWFR